MRRYFGKRIVAFLIIIGVVFSALILFYDFHKSDYPRRLEVGDTWRYSVVFPDSHEYVLTETVQAEQANDTYLIFRNDSQHLSTGNLWLTSQWYETGESQLQIGNLDASSNLTYHPPIQLVHVPLHVGDEWEVDSNSTARVIMRNQTQIITSSLHQVRKTISDETIHTLVGYFHAFKINVSEGGLLYETLWFSVDLGQVVYAKFYNPLGEAVTLTLTGYHLRTPPNESSIAITLNPVLSNVLRVSEVLCTSRTSLSNELKNPHG